MQDFYNNLFIFFLIGNNKLTVNLSQIFFRNVFNDIKHIVNFFPIDVYPAAFFAIFFFVVFLCHKKIDILALFKGIHISISEFSVAQGLIIWNGSKGLRPSEPEERASVINAASQPFEIICLLFSEVKELKRSILHFAWRSFGIENLHGTLRSSISLPT